MPELLLGSRGPTTTGGAKSKNYIFEPRTVVLGMKQMQGLLEGVASKRSRNVSCS